ncbi:MAG TPA: hypothetical protein EYO72_01730 [Marine Group III euryarchaeote]|nr:hypothetical protein [Marine Group III euryarchaeote]
MPIPLAVIGVGLGVGLLVTMGDGPILFPYGVIPSPVGLAYGLHRSRGDPAGYYHQVYRRIPVTFYA